MKPSEIEEILEQYGLDRVLEDNQTNLVEVMGILEQLGYIYLDMYLPTDANHDLFNRS